MNRSVSDWRLVFKEYRQAAYDFALKEKSAPAAQEQARGVGHSFPFGFFSL